jgi:hypothetical protein
LLIKQYQIGKITTKLLSLKANLNDQLILSCGKGSGMKLLSLSQGKLSWSQEEEELEFFLS